MYDLLLKGGRICDGTGEAIVEGSVGVENGRITHVGPDAGLSAKREIDVEGAVIAPGFIDPHTHYDAQICWDETLTSSPWHGVTTVCMGNCGVGVAPAKPEARGALLVDLQNVEAMPYDVMAEGIPWQWESYGEYLEFINNRKVSINVAGLVSLTALRYYVMGEAALDRGANAEETSELKALLKVCMQEGAFGFSGDFLPHHVGYKGRPLACSNASQPELKALCEVLRELGRGTISVSLASMKLGTRPLGDEDIEMLRMMVETSGRRITWLPLLSKFNEPDFPKHTLAKLGSLVEMAVPQITPRPMVFLVTLTKPFRFGWYDTWKPAISATRAEQRALYADQEWRKGVLQEMATHERQFQWKDFYVKKVVASDLQKYLDRTVLEIAKTEGKEPLEVFLDIGLADDMESIFELQNANLDPRGVEWLMRRPELLPGVSDAGAHVDQLCDVVYSTYILEHWVRRKGVVSLEEAVRRMTSMPASVFGIPIRGKLEKGYAADIVVFDPDRIRAMPPMMVADLPLNAERLIARAEGIRATFVGGTQLVDNDEIIDGALPGRALHSGHEA